MNSERRLTMTKKEFIEWLEHKEIEVLKEMNNFKNGTFGAVAGSTEYLCLHGIIEKAKELEVENETKV